MKFIVKNKNKITQEYCYGCGTQGYDGSDSEDSYSTGCIKFKCEVHSCILLKDEVIEEK